ncbi:MAG: hypothetical protein IPH85_13890 [Ignavibacteria bacterium]|nr:hypothetical protein [Ignavibacteria bacterium]
MDGPELGVLDAAILEMIRADGSISDKKTVSFRFKKQHKIVRCEMLFDEAGISYHTALRSGGVTEIRTHVSERLSKLIALLGCGISKGLGEWVMRMSLEAREAYLDELQFWDGSVATYGGSGQTVVHSAKWQDVYWIVEMALASGRSASADYDLPNVRGFSRSDGVIPGKGRTRKDKLGPPKSGFLRNSFLFDYTDFCFCCAQKRKNLGYGK